MPLIYRKTHLKPQRFFIALLCLSVTLMVSGCAQLQQSTAADALVESQDLKNPKELSSWKSQGKVAFRKANEGGHANFTWEQNKDRFLIRLTGPMSSGGVVIEGEPGHVELRDSEGQVWVADSPEALMEARLGWRLPIEGMKYWIKGVAEPNTPKQQRQNSAKALVQLQQRGWVINYQTYRITRNYRLPQKMSLNNDIFNLKVMIRQWRFP